MSGVSVGCFGSGKSSAAAALTVAKRACEAGEGTGTPWDGSRRSGWVGRAPEGVHEVFE